MLFMGIDIGSSGCKVSVTDHLGEIHFSSHRSYSFTYTDNTSELDPLLVWEKVKDAVKEATSECRGEKIEIVSATSFGEMIVLSDDEGNPLCNSISYGDKRGREQIERIASDIGADKIYSITGTTPDAMYSLAKLLWIKENDAKVYEKTKRINLFADFILQKLGAKFHMDYSLASRTQIFDVKSRCWSDEILKCANIKRELFPDVIPAGTPVGNVKKEFADELGLSSDTLILSGGHDQIFASIGAGILTSGTALDGMGSNECIVPVFDSPLIHENMKKSGLACVPYPIENKYVTYAFSRTCASIIDWYRNLMGSMSYDELFSEIEEIPSNVLFLPHFLGAATPYMDDDSKGAFFGLTLGTKRSEITKAIIDGFNYEMKVNLDTLNGAGFEISTLLVCGGLSQNDKVLQTKADILGIKVQRLHTPNTGTLAVAVFGCVAKGIYPSLDIAMKNLVKTTDVFMPDEKKHLLYMEQYEKYKRLYPSLKTVQKGV